ncbi:hypothetical protein GLOIN_2v1824527 [Rhizophagus irregularis DAOM 181602=DAOM 197198]|nr:hypothetical protein GLOIN_2v1824527 [Rhizophagus irregularis DAOM 181602=DAOM 197198]
MDIEYKQNVWNQELTRKEFFVNAIAFMDDMTIISKSRDGIMEMLEICHSFYEMNDIKANPKKYEVIRINDNENKQLIINNTVILKMNSVKGNRFLGIFFTHDNKRQKHIEKIREMIKGFVKIMSRKVLTDKQTAKLWNITLIPAIEYQLLGVVLSKKEAEALMIPFNTLMKHKSGMPKTLPNCIIYDKDLYGVKNIYNLQLECISKNIMYMANGNENLSMIFQIQMKSLPYRFWTSQCFAEIATEDKFLTKTYIGDALIILGINNIRICDHEGRKELKINHRIEGGNIRIEEILENSYNMHKKSLQSCGVLFVEQLMEPYTNRLLKWTHFIRYNESTPRIEPNWFRTVKQQISIEDKNNNRIVVDDIKIRHSDDKKRILLRKDIEQKSVKKSNKELITWNLGKNIIYSIKSKRSRHKKYDEIGRHLVEDRDLNIDNEDDNSPYLVDCKGCEYNIGRKFNKEKCFIYIEKDVATTFEGRNEKMEAGENKIFKPYMTRENIYRQNELIKQNVTNNRYIEIDSNMSTDEEEDIIDNCLKWLEFVIENRISLIKWLNLL